MGLADIKFTDLASLQQRASIPKRVFKSRLQSVQKDSEGNVLGWLWNGAKQLGGFLLSEAGKFLNWSFASIWGFLTSTIQYIWNFDWNMTDESIDQQIQSRWNAILGQLGGALGNAFGHLACGVLPGAVIFCFNEPLGAYVLKNATEEFADEFFENVGQLSKAVFQAATQNLILWSFKNIRRLIKSNSALVGKLFGDKAKKMVSAWGEKGSQPWSFAIAVENAIESIPNEGVRNFVEEFLEESWEACVEAGYVVANSLDSYYAQQKLQKQVEPVLGADRHVEIVFDRENPDLSIAIGGQEELVKNQVVQAMTTYQIMREKDVGYIYGHNPEDAETSRKYKPDVVLLFSEKRDKNTPKGKRLLTGRISFRIMNKDSETITEADIQTLATKVKAKFGTPAYKWNKADKRYSYTDWDKGYQFSLLVTSEIEARRITEQVLDLQGHSPDWKLLNKCGEPVIPKSNVKGEKRTILGQVVEQKIVGKVGIVEFQKALLYLDGLKGKPIILFDLTGKHKKVIVR
ncbi:hypothetical protein JYQ62_16150 [Nostoc sp. UHCC 0702]|nr:hypothetical protein JYQ62_16150 [Nostoc sp. UHCC 0702]